MRRFAFRARAGQGLACQPRYPTTVNILRIFLLRERAFSEELCGRMLGWRYSEFSVHNQVRVAADDAEGRKKLAGYMLRAPLSLAKMSYDAASGMLSA